MVGLTGGLADWRRGRGLKSRSRLACCRFSGCRAWAEIAFATGVSPPVVMAATTVSTHAVLAASFFSIPYATTHKQEGVHGHDEADRAADVSVDVSTLPPER